MQKVFSIPVIKPSSWKPPYIEDNEEESAVPLEFYLFKNYDSETYFYRCQGCLSAGGEIGDIFCSSTAEETEWPYGDEGVPKRLAHEMFSHARQHEILWRWSINRIPSPIYDKYPVLPDWKKEPEELTGSPYAQTTGFGSLA
jgi:hypothetical protein